MVRQDLQKRQAEADIEARIMERLTLSRATSVSSSRRALYQAAGGVRTFERLLEVRAIGVSRVGATATKVILDDAKAKLGQAEYPG